MGNWLFLKIKKWKLLLNVGRMRKEGVHRKSFSQSGRGVVAASSNKVANIMPSARPLR